MADESKYPTRIAPYGLRMPPDLKNRVMGAAKKNNRPLNAEIVSALEAAYPDSHFAAAEFAYFLETVAHAASKEIREEGVALLNSTLAEMESSFTASASNGEIIFRSETKTKTKTVSD